MVTALEVFERIVNGLGMPDEARILLGLAPLHPVGLEHLGPIEGHTSPMYKISSAAYGAAMHRGFRRFVGELQRTAQRVM